MYLHSFEEVVPGTKLKVWASGVFTFGYSVTSGCLCRASSRITG